MPFFCQPVRLLIGIFAVVSMVACDQFGEAKPEQPIQFSHQNHVEKQGMACLYCHQMADKSAVATVPPVATCMNCHKYIPGSQRPEEVAKVRAYWEKQEPIPWNKVHDEPDFVYFSHKRHVKYFVGCFESKAPEQWDECKLAEGDPDGDFKADANDLDRSAQMATCAQCHGQVWTFTVGQRVASLNMGWCVTCHQKRVALEQDPAEQKKVHDRLLDCWTCHK